MVDNASTDKTVLIVSQFPNIDFTILNENLGFGKANNFGIKKANSLGFNSFFLLNQDTWIACDSIEKLILQQRNNSIFGILSPMHFDNSEENLDKNFETYFSKKTNISEYLFEVPFVNAAAWLISKKCLDKVGLFEPAFNHYGEDRNFCNRTHFHGFKIGIVSDDKIVHDRTIFRKFDKDLQQSKYQILNTLININLSKSRTLIVGIMQVFGLPKFFYKYFGFLKSIIMMIELLIYFLLNILKYNKIKLIRQKSIEGKNGIDA